MSSPGINPLAIIAPDLYAKQLGIAQKQALAQSLLQQGAGDPGRAAFGGVRNAGNTILGALLAKRANQDLAGMYAPPQPDMGTQQPQDMPVSPTPAPAQVSNSSNETTAQPSQGLTMGQMLQGRTAQPQQAQGPRTPASVIGNAIPDLPGLSHTQSMLAYAQGPTEYWKALAASRAPTDIQKNAGFVAPGDQQAQQGIVGATLAKAGSIPITRGMALVPDGRGGMMQIYAPNTQEGIGYETGPDGRPQAYTIPGSQAAIAGYSAAQGLGKAATTPAIGYDANNQPVATNQAQMLGSNPQAPLGIRSNNPGNLQPGGREATYSTPSEGILRAASNLDAYAKQGINTISGVISRWAPAQGGNNTQAYIQDVSRRLGIDPNQPINLADPRVKGAVLDAIFTHENGSQAMNQAAGGNRPLLPELPKGTPEYLAGQGKDAAERHDAVVAAAAESPMRINVLDNIIKLSESGVNTGPGAEWQANLQGYIANTPGLSSIMGKTRDRVGQFQELQKFMYQNALRNWQAAGGTGTDSQMQAAAVANPNDHLFPAALQQIAKWGKASELAVQGKANAQDQFLSQRGNNPQAQVQFEKTWRNSFDPKVFQYSLMTPQQKQEFAHNELKTPQAAKAFLAKQQQLRSLGALQ